MKNKCHLRNFTQFLIAHPLEQRGRNISFQHLYLFWDCLVVCVFPLFSPPAPSVTSSFYVPLSLEIPAPILLSKSLPPPPLSKDEHVSPNVPVQIHLVLCKQRGHLLAGHLLLRRQFTRTFRDWSPAQEPYHGISPDYTQGRLTVLLGGILRNKIFSILIQQATN